MKVAAIQMPTVKDKIQNIRTAGTYIEKIKAENPDFVILPEMFCCPYQTENFPVYAEKEGESFLTACKSIIKDVDQDGISSINAL